MLYRTMALTRYPRRTSASTRWDPMNPSAPVTATTSVIRFLLSIRASDRRARGPATAKQLPATTSRTAGVTTCTIMPWPRRAISAARAAAPASSGIARSRIVCSSRARNMAAPSIRYAASSGTSARPGRARPAAARHGGGDRDERGGAAHVLRQRGGQQQARAPPESGQVAGGSRAAAGSAAGTTAGSTRPRPCSARPAPRPAARRCSGRRALPGRPRWERSATRPRPRRRRWPARRPAVRRRSAGGRCGGRRGVVQATAIRPAASGVAASAAQASCSSEGRAAGQARNTRSRSRPGPARPAAIFSVPVTSSTHAPSM